MVYPPHGACAREAGADAGMGPGAEGEDPPPRAWAGADAGAGPLLNAWPLLNANCARCTNGGRSRLRGLSGVTEGLRGKAGGFFGVSRGFCPILREGRFLAFSENVFKISEGLFWAVVGNVFKISGLHFFDILNSLSKIVRGAVFALF